MTANSQTEIAAASAPAQSPAPIPPHALHRLRVAAGLLVGLRGHDFRAAGTFMRATFGKYAFPVRLAKFVGWGCRQMFVVVPRTLSAGIEFARPVSRVPYWLSKGNPLANHPWAGDASAALPQLVDTIVIGAGMTGASLAYHWAKRAAPDRTMVVLDMGDPASGASGRNGGSVVMGRYFAMVHKTLTAHWSRAHTDWTSEKRDRLAKQFAAAYCAAAYRNADMIEQAVRVDGIECDYARNGWIQIREAGEQAWLTDSVEKARASGFTDWNRIAPQQIKQITGLNVSTDSGWSKRAGQFHPAKWVWSLFRKAMQSPNVALFTRTKVLRVEDAGEHYRVHTDRGVIRARHVVNATESYTAALHRQFSGAIRAVQTQMCSGTGGPQALPSHTTASGSTFFADRRGQDILLGSDETYLPDDRAGQNKPSRWITKFILGELLRFAGPYSMRVQNEWSGTVGFTPDQFPVVGVMDGKRQYVIGGMCGSGTGVSFNAGRCIVNRILDLRDEPDDYPEQYFSPTRILDPQRHPWPDASN